MNSILFSFIIPAYNISEYVRNAVESITQQSYKRLEVIIVDDGSSDKTGEICEQLSSVDSRVRVIHEQQNLGPSHARNIGLEMASGDYILFLDGDDYLASPNIIDKIEKVIEKKRPELIYCGYIKKNILSGNEKEQKITLGIDNNNITEERLLKSGRYSNACWSKVYSKHLIDRLGMNFPEGRLNEDLKWNSRLLENIRGGGSIPRTSCGVPGNENYFNK